MSLSNHKAKKGLCLWLRVGMRQSEPGDWDGDTITNSETRLLVAERRGRTAQFVLGHWGRWADHLSRQNAGSKKVKGARGV